MIRTYRQALARTLPRAGRRPFGRQKKMCGAFLGRPPLFQQSFVLPLPVNIRGNLNFIRKNPPVKGFQRVRPRTNSASASSR